MTEDQCQQRLVELACGPEGVDTEAAQLVVPLSPIQAELTNNFQMLVHLSVNMLLTLPRVIIVGYYERLMLRSPQIADLVTAEVNAGRINEPQVLDLSTAPNLQKIYRKMLQKFERQYNAKVGSFLEIFIDDVFVGPMQERFSEIVYQK